MNVVYNLPILIISKDFSTAFSTNKFYLRGLDVVVKTFGDGWGRSLLAFGPFLLLITGDAEGVAGVEAWNSLEAIWGLLSGEDLGDWWNCK